MQVVLVLFEQLDPRQPNRLEAAKPAIAANKIKKSQVNRRTAHVNEIGDLSPKYDTFASGIL